MQAGEGGFMKNYYRPLKSRNLYAVERDGDSWTVEYVQIGQAEEAQPCLEQALGLVSYLELPLLAIPTEPFKIDLYAGMSGCKDYSITTPPKVWYDLIPGTTIIKKCVGKTVKTDLLHISMFGKINSGLSVTPENYWQLKQLEWQNYNPGINPVKYPDLYGPQVTEFIEIKEKKEWTDEETGIKSAPDNSIFILPDGTVIRTCQIINHYQNDFDLYSKVRDFIPALQEYGLKVLHAIDEGNGSRIVFFRNEDLVVWCESTQTYITRDHKGILTAWNPNLPGLYIAEEENPHCYCIPSDEGEKQAFLLPLEEIDELLEGNVKLWFAREWNYNFCKKENCNPYRKEWFTLEEYKNLPPEPPSRTIQIGCQTVKIVDEKEVHWKEYIIKLGQWTEIDREDIDLIEKNDKKIQEYLIILRCRDSKQIFLQEIKK